MKILRVMALVVVFCGVMAIRGENVDARGGCSYPPTVETTEVEAE